MSADQPTPDDPRPLHQQAAPQVIASPSHLTVGEGEQLVWWRPGWIESFRLLSLGWKTLYAVLFTLFGAITFFTYWWSLGQALLPIWVKLLLTLFGLVAVSFGAVVKRAARARKEPFCIHCGYNLTGLPDHHRCPECGRPYEWRIIDEYRRDPDSFIQRYEALRRLPTAAKPFEAGTQRRPRRRDGT